MERIKFWLRKGQRKTVQQVCSRLYINPNFDLSKSILVAGSARSGTTWLGDIISAQIPCRTLFEPFNCDLVPSYRDFHYFQYMRPGMENSEFQAFAQKVLTGKIRNRWIDHQNERIFSSYRLIKEIRANLALKWLRDHFSEVPILFLIRHPCAVVLSRMELGWATDTDIEPFLLQQDLVEDHLANYLDLIENASSDEEKHAIIWSVSNLVPLKQFKPGELRKVYYENLCTGHETELRSIFNVIGFRYEPDLININRPSTTARMKSAVVTGQNKIARWKSELRPSQIEKILRVVDAFGLGHLYGESLLPLDNDKM